MQSLTFKFSFDPDTGEASVSRTTENIGEHDGTQTFTAEPEGNSVQMLTTVMSQLDETMANLIGVMIATGDIKQTEGETYHVEVITDDDDNPVLN